MNIGNVNYIKSSLECSVLFVSLGLDNFSSNIRDGPRSFMLAIKEKTQTIYYFDLWRCKASQTSKLIAASFRKEYKIQNLAPAN